MTISSETRKAGPFNGNGVTTSFPFVFKTFAKSDVKVIFTDADEIETILVLDSDYTVTLNVDQNANPGGSISYSTLATGEKLTVLGAVEYTQETDVQNQGGFYPEVIENAFDKITMLVQQVKEIADRAVVVPASSSVTSENYLDTINTYKVEAAASASAASTSASNAYASEASALEYSNLANKWAEEAEDVQVETGKFSAKHWAAKAEFFGGDKLPITGGSLTGPINEARGTVTMHATTMNLWAQPNIIDGTGSAVTITAIANAPQAGAKRTLYPITGTVITNGATFAVDGAANYTTSTGDALEFEAVTTSTYKVHITKKDGTAVAGSLSYLTDAEYKTGTDTTKVLNAAVARANNLVLGTAVAASGTAVDITGIPSWAKRVTLMLNDFSLSGTDNILIQIGDSGGIETTGYISSTTNTTSTVVTTFTTAAILVSLASAGRSSRGIMSFVNMTGNVWVFSGCFNDGVANAQIVSGAKTLSDVLTQIRVTRSGTDTFDSGSINAIWE